MQAIRKKFRRWLRTLQNWSRRSLPYSWKRLIKRFLPQPPALPIQIPLPSGSVDDAIQIWAKDPKLRQALLQATHPNRQTARASIIMLTHNKLPLTRLCIENLYRHTDYSNFELIVVDNASQDSTRAYLESLRHIVPNLHVIFNSRNEGFARANNQGILQSCGDYIALLNNDTIVTAGWLSRLVQHLERDEQIGMVGPVTNSAGNEQMIPAAYANLEELESFALQRLMTHVGQSFEIEMLATLPTASAN